MKTKADLVRQARQLIEAKWKASHLWSENTAQAKLLLEEALVASPNDPLALTCLGAVLSDQGDHRKALTVLRKAVVSGSQDRNTYFNLAVAVMNTGTQEEAMDWFKKARALSADPESWEAYFDPQAH